MEQRESVTIISGGQKMFGMLHRPDVDQNVPLVIFLHGFGSNKIGTNRCYVTFAQQLAQAGIASLRFDFRGSGDSEGSLSNLTFSDLVEDAKNIFCFAKKLSWINTQQIALFGSSLGGTIGLAAAKSLKDLAAIALWSPIASGELWAQDFMTRNPGVTKDSQGFLASFRGLALSTRFQEEFAQFSAAHILPLITNIPLLHMHGENDQTVSFLHQQVYQKYCSQREAAASFLSFPNTDHSLGTATAFPKIIKTTLQWLKQYLVGDMCARELV